MEIASALVAIGEAKKDPILLGAAARLLSGINGKVANDRASQAGGNLVFYDVGRILEQAKSFAGDKNLLEQISSDGARPFCCSTRPIVDFFGWRGAGPLGDDSMLKAAVLLRFSARLGRVPCCATEV